MNGLKKENNLNMNKEKQEQTLPLAVKIDPQNGIATLKVFEKLVPMAMTMIADNSKWLKIDDEDTHKWCKEERTKLNKYRDMVKKYRLDCMANFFGEFEAQCKQLEKAFDNASKLHTDALKKYEDSLKPKENPSATPAVFHLIISSTDPEAITKVAKYATKYGCNVEAK